MSDVTKRCKCGEAKINKCADPWYMKNFIWQGVKYADSVTRWALVNLGETVTTRTRADEVCEIMRTKIRSGEYVKAKVATKARPKLATDLTLAELVAAFDRDVLGLQVADDDAVTDETLATHRSRLARLVAFEGFGARPAATLDAAAMIAFRTSPAIRVLGRSSWAKHRGLYNRLFRYAKHAGIMTVNPFDADDVSEEQHAVLRRKKGEPRSRRLKAGEEDRLLRAALGGRFKFDAQRTHDLIVAALECAGRLGELLALKWADVTLATAPAVGMLAITGTEKGAGKTGARVVPISARLDAVLRRRQINALTGKPYPDSAYVFGNEVGEKLKQLGSWEGTVVRAQGHKPETKTGGNLNAASWSVYKGADLHFHDLRREAASRWLDSGAFELHEVRDLLGHSNIAQTSEYLAVKAGSTIDAMRRYNAQRAAAEVLPLAVGATDHKSTTNGDAPVAAGSPLALVKGNNPSETR